MGKGENTIIALEAALDRIAQGKPRRIPNSRKLSVRAVEEEANLGNGSGYYYPDFVDKVKKTIAGKDNGDLVQPEIQIVRAKLNEQKRIKTNFKVKFNDAREQLALFAAAQHHLNDKLVQAMARISDLEHENTELRQKLVNLNRNQIAPIR
ncbi:hypothetical protein [Rheinheimera sp.]|uniref:hypothetical protein n=1 Tax=Rheinheimera sp. TaxID=1869214 RepID=UPI003D2752F4